MRIQMLTVGREMGIKEKVVVCRQCAWQDAGNKLSIGLTWIKGLAAYLCVYRCPECDSFDIGYVAKVLPFRFRNSVDQGQPESSPTKKLADDLK